MDEQKYENLKKALIESFDTSDQLLGGSKVFHQVDWFLVVNTGALLWFIGMSDKFTINNQLVYKWWVILTILCLLVSEIFLYRLRLLLFKLNLELKMIKVECLKAKNLDEINIDKHLDMLKVLPSIKIGYIVDFFFLIGIISMVVYIITYFIRYK